MSFVLLIVASGGCVHPEARAGYRALDERAYTVAAQHFARAVQARPNDLRFRVELGRAYVGAGDAVRAQAAFREALALSPDSVQLTVLLGHSLELGRDYDGAEASYRRAVALAPTRAYPLRVLGGRLLRWDRPADAIAPLSQAVAREPAHVETHNALAIALAKAGDLPGSERVFRAALQRFPRERRLWLGLGAVLVTRRENERALAHYSAMVAQFPRFAPAQVARAELLLALGDRSGALAALDAALALAPQDPRIAARRAELAR